MKGSPEAIAGPKVDARWVNRGPKLKEFMGS